MSQNNSNSAKSNKVLLAFSGGLDTSYCIKYLKNEKKLEVHTAVVNTGGFSEEELQAIEKKALELGSVNHTTLEVTEEYYDKIIKYLIFGNVLRNNTYPLSVSAERTYQAIALAKHAAEIEADYIAHGSTGAGNDQIRFDLVFQLIAPQIEILTPIRDMKLSREQEVDYLKLNGVSLDWEKAKYSINKGLWGTSVGGAETLTSHKSLPEEAYPSPLLESEMKTVTLEFEKGELCGINNEKMNAVKVIQTLEEIANKYAIGRDTHVGDTIIGIKGRVGFEAAAASIIIKGHHTLEKHTLSKWQLYWKEQLSNWYGMFVHESQYFEPVMRNIETFLEDSQSNVTGKVFIELHSYRFVIQGVESDYDLMKSDFGEYGEMNKNWSGDDVKGFTKILGNPLQIFTQIQNKNQKNEK
ncbi:argininosuccinate synthase [Bernardetia litoralis DSM 6794]|uniref:argininosuccinate synthase n=1 Tax=Bernardetia litoralis (strain ATCC 23117 / DSM 6794 / NBRC 15988 / NCIMB 1366 / Fx l1 / Sio-4) TaxID=880071 RepID=I4AQY4_BERLS|nr:argininosuccinate synthase domain-containing protein [Bernardetia litoralis]AFM06369.1 argininosuccinate synthase [Bernardetia litoralis DSM 6794]